MTRINIQCFVTLIWPTTWEDVPVSVMKVFSLLCRCKCHRNCRWTGMGNVKQNVTRFTLVQNDGPGGLQDAKVRSWKHAINGWAEFVTNITENIVSLEGQRGVYDFSLCFMDWINLQFLLLLYSGRNRRLFINWLTVDRVISKPTRYRGHPSAHVIALKIWPRDQYLWLKEHTWTEWGYLVCSTRNFLLVPMVVWTWITHERGPHCDLLRTGAQPRCTR